MLDTNICIYVIKNYPAKLRERFNRLAEQLSISSITLGELYYGAEKSARRLENLQAVEQFAGAPRGAVVPAEGRGALRSTSRRLERLGRPIGAHDMLIGAHARAEGLIVVTNNAREFRRLPGLRVENWV